MQKLDPPAHVALVLCEMQPTIVAASRTVGEQALRRAAKVLVDVAGALAIPVWTPAVPLPSGATPDLVEELASQRPRLRSVVSAFDDPVIAAEVAASGRKLVALGGVSSEIAVLHSALGARQLGYDVHLLVDACGGLSERTERSAFAQMQAAGVVLSNVSSFLTLLTPDMASTGGAAVMGGLAALWGW